MCRRRLTTTSGMGCSSAGSKGGMIFGEFIHPRRYTVAARYDDGALRIFGDDANDRILDGLMTSIAMPPFYPPWEVDGVLYLDGGVTSHLPVQAAVARGADEIFALRNGHGFMVDSAPFSAMCSPLDRRRSRCWWNGRPTWKSKPCSAIDRCGSI